MEDKLKEYIKFKIAVSKMKEKEKNNAEFTNKKIGIVACFCIILTTSCVFATDISNFIKNKFNLGNGIETAINNGYIKETNMDFVNSTINIDNIDVATKISDFYIDDYNIGIHFDFQFQNDINNLIDLNNLKNIDLIDLIIVDENNKIVFNGANQEDFEFFCIKNNLSYKYEDYMKGGVNNFITAYNSENNIITLTYNIYNEKYPHLKELHLNFSKIKITKKDTEDAIILSGNWKIHLEIPEVMYNRSYEYYKVVNCDNDNFDIYTAKVSDTGFEIGITISDIEEPTYPEELKKKENEINSNNVNKDIEIVDEKTVIIPTTILSNINNVDNVENNALKELYSQSPYKEMYEEYWKKMQPINVNGESQIITSNENTEGSYVLNSNNEKFRCTMSPTRKQNANFIYGNKFDFYETFEMTKYDATNKISVIIEFYGNPVTIELEKIDKD